MNTYLRYAIYTGLFAILFIPFIVANDFFFPFITGKNFAFRIIVEIIFALWFILALRDVSVRPKKSALLLAVGAFLVSLGISTVLAENPSKAFWSNFERMEGYVTLLHLGAYLVVMTSMVQGEKLWRGFWNTSIGVSALLGMYGILQLAGTFVINQGGVRVDATFGNATYLAVYMLFHAFITIYALSSWARGRMAQGAYAVALVLQFLMIFYTATRGTILGLVGGLLVAGIIFALFSKDRPLFKKAGMGLVALILVVSGGFYVARDSSFVQNNEVLTRIASISLEEGKTRLTIWGMALQGFQERPVFGWGQDGFNYVFNKYYEPSLYGQEPWFDRAHNIFFDWLIAGGVLGLGLYLSFFAIALWYLWRPGNTFSIVDRALFTGLLAGYGFHNIFVFDNLMSYVLFFSVLAYLSTRHTKESTPLFSSTSLSPTVQTLGASLSIIALLVVVYTVNVPGMARASGLISAIQPYEGGVTQNFVAFKEVIGPHGLGRQEAHEQLLQFATQLRNPRLASLSDEVLRNEVALYARDEFAKELERTPNDARLLVFYGSFLRTIGDRAGAETVLSRAQELSPRKQPIIFERAILAVENEELEKGFALFKEAYELEPAFSRARVLYAAMALRVGDRALFESLLMEGFGTLTPDDDTILQAYLDAGDTDRIVAIAELRVQKDPANLERHLQLAAAYLGDGKRVQAVASLREAMRLNPDFTAQGTYYITEIEAGRNP